MAATEQTMAMSLIRQMLLKTREMVLSFRTATISTLFLKDLSAAELKAAQDYWNQKGSVSSASGSQYGDRNNRAQQTTISAGQGQDLAGLLAQLDATPYLNAM